VLIVVYKQQELQERKNYMKMQDLQRHQNERLNDLEEEERAKSEALRQKAMQQMQEQEDEIKRLNEVFLGKVISFMKLFVCVEETSARTEKQ
jgi:uncharacterized protein with von Willebrand factor type A (vWA) domain